MKVLVFSTPNGSWEVVPENTFVGIVLGVVIAYFLFRIFLWVCALYDIYSGAPKRWIFLPWRSNWGPDTIPLNKPAIHSIVAGLLVVACVVIGEYFGWIELVKQ